MSFSSSSAESLTKRERASHTVYASSLLDCEDSRIEETKYFLQALCQAFAEPFTLTNVETGEAVHADFDSMPFDFSNRLEILAEVERRSQPTIVEDVSPLIMLAIPMPLFERGLKLVAVGVFSYQEIENENEVFAAAKTFGVDSQRAIQWIAGREIWSPRILLQLANTLFESYVSKSEISRLQNEIHDAVTHARDAYLELGLLHRLTSNLHISENESELWQNALVQLSDTVQAESFAIVANPDGDQYELADLFTDDVDGVWTYGKPAFQPAMLHDIVESIGLDALRQPLVLNRIDTSLPTWQHPEVRELVCVPILDGEQPLAWLFAFNHTGKALRLSNEFDNVELRLLCSVATILGMHSRNIGLYHEQTDLFSGLVRSMSSAIDAKDHYTSGHSERVAKLSVALAKQLQLDQETIAIIHLGGLLHDIGKIGIDDTVLNKPSSLTETEFQALKLHPQFGYDILQGIQQLQKVLPIVLHHHENWDGSGYPAGLAGTDIPLIARIVSVADSFDAMSSDRPYRKGLSVEAIDSIFRNGAGTQWDADIIDAYFEISEEIYQLTSKSTEPSLLPNVPIN